jgi:hypothetical protein
MAMVMQEMAALQLEQAVLQKVLQVLVMEMDIAAA